MKLNEIFLMSMQSIRGNRLRTMLTMLGIVVGIFSIIVIMTVITMLQKSIENGVSQLGQNTFQIQKFPAIMNGGHDAWLKYRNRQDLTLEDYNRLTGMLSQAKYIGAEQWQGGQVVKFNGQETNPNISVAGITAGAMKTNNWSTSNGRDIRELDVKYSNDVCDIGQDIAKKLFPYINPVGQVIRVNNFPLTVVGVLDKQPALFGQTRDSYLIMPITTFQNLYGKLHRSIIIQQ